MAGARARPAQSPVKARCRPGAGQALAGCVRISFVFSSYFLGVLPLFCLGGPPFTIPESRARVRRPVHAEVDMESGFLQRMALANLLMPL